jgi:uncharacterized protein (DUF1778 family)
MSLAEERGRVTARVSLQVEERLKEAAELTGATMNQFLVQAALEKADRIIEREHLIRLTREDAAMLIDMLESPPKPNAALKRAFERSGSKVPNDPKRRRTKSAP